MAELVVVRSESATAVVARVRLFSCMNAHVAIPSGPVVKRLATDGTLLALLRIAHTRRLQLLHVVVQLHLRINVGHCSRGVTEV